MNSLRVLVLSLKTRQKSTAPMNESCLYYSILLKLQQSLNLSINLLYRKSRAGFYLLLQDLSPEFAIRKLQRRKKLKEYITKAYFLIKNFIR